MTSNAKGGDESDVYAQQGESTYYQQSSASTPCFQCTVWRRPVLRTGLQVAGSDQHVLLVSESEYQLGSGWRKWQEVKDL